MWYHRHSIRLPDFDYSTPWWYYVTICTRPKKCWFGNIKNGQMILNKIGKCVESEWLKTTQIRPNVGLDDYVIMPNHLHGIIIIEFNLGTIPEWATGSVAPTKPTIKPNSLGSIIGQFKSVVTKQIRKMGYHDFKWQRNYYEHVIRNERNLYNIRRYIRNNPLKWEIDKKNPRNCG
jgi:putative transposase